MIMEKSGAEVVLDTLRHLQNLQLGELNSKNARVPNLRVVSNDTTQSLPGY